MPVEFLKNRQENTGYLFICITRRCWIGEKGYKYVFQTFRVSGIFDASNHKELVARSVLNQLTSLKWVNWLTIIVNEKFHLKIGHGGVTI